MIELRKATCWLLGGLLLSAAPVAAQSVPGLPKTGTRCARTLSNNDILFPQPHVVSEIHHILRIKNGGSEAALVKVIEKSRGERILFYVARGMTAQIDLQSGNYLIQYALGGHLAADCETVIQPSFVGEFPGIQRLAVTEDATSYSTAVLEFTLFQVRNGNVKPRTIRVADFNED